MSYNNSTNFGSNFTTGNDSTLENSENETDYYEWNTPPFDTSVSNILLAVVLTALVVVTLFGNLLVILSFAIERQLLQPFNLFILNLAVTDFLVAITGMTFYVLDTLLGYWPLGTVMCDVWIYFDFSLTFASAFTVVAISVDRFWCVTWAIHYRTHNNKNKTFSILACIWLFVIAIVTPPFIADRLKHRENYYCIWEPSENREFVTFVAVIGHHVPTAIMILCYIKVFIVMRKRSSIGASTGVQNEASVRLVSLDIPNNTSNINADNNRAISVKVSTVEPSNGLQISTIGVTNISQRVSPPLSPSLKNSASARDAESKHPNKPTSSWNQNAAQSTSTRPVNRGTRASYQQQRERKVFITLSYVLISYILCWFPFYVVFDISAWKSDLVPGGLYSFFFWTSYTYSTLNPFIYAYTSKEFRSAFMKVLKLIFKCSK